MKKLHMSQTTKALLGSFAGMAFSASVHATPVGYWQLDDGTAGTDIGAVTSEINPGSFTSALIAGNDGAGTAPTFTSDVPGQVIIDGVGGPVVNANNTTAANFVRGATASTGTFLQLTSSGQITNPSSAFTIEGFFKNTANETFGTLFNKEQFATTSNARIGTDFTDARLIARNDDFGGSSGGQVVVDTNNSGIVTTGSFIDGGWHHIAFVYDGAGTVSLYYDYINIGSYAADPTDNWANGPLSIAGFTGNAGSGNGIKSLIADEIRYSTSALDADQMLRAVIPEPSAYGAMAGLFMAVVVSLHRRRKQQ